MLWSFAIVEHKEAPGRILLFTEQWFVVLLGVVGWCCIRINIHDLHTWYQQ